MNGKLENRIREKRNGDTPATERWLAILRI